MEINRIPMHGRTMVVVRCTCNHENYFYEWSWAGHGKAKCKGCGSWIIRWGGIVEPPKPKKSKKGG